MLAWRIRIELSITRVVWAVPGRSHRSLLSSLPNGRLCVCYNTTGDYHKTMKKTTREKNHRPGTQACLCSRAHHRSTGRKKREVREGVVAWSGDRTRDVAVGRLTTSPSSQFSLMTRRGVIRECRTSIGWGGETRGAAVAKAKGVPSIRSVGNGYDPRKADTGREKRTRVTIHKSKSTAQQPWNNEQRASADHTAAPATACGSELGH